MKQWHNEIDPEYDQRLGDFFESFLHSQLSELDLTEDDLRSWSSEKSDYERGVRVKTGDIDKWKN